MSPRGLNIVFTGIDGIGKSTVAAAVAKRLRARGRTVVTPSWQDYLRPGADDPRSRVLAPPLLATLGALHTGARDRDSSPLPGGALVSGEGAPWVARTDSGGLGIASHSPDALLAAGLSMLSAQLLLHEVVVRPALAEGHVVIQESYGAKAVLKAALLAERALAGAGDEYDRTRADALRAMARACLRAPLSPALGVLLTGDPRDAERRKQGVGGVTLTEHFGLTGAPGPAAATFTVFQDLLQGELRDFAEGGPWTEVPVGALPRAESVERSADTVLELAAPHLPAPPVRVPEGARR